MRRFFIALIMCGLVVAAGCSPATSEAPPPVEERTLDVAVNLADEIDVFIELTNDGRSSEALEKLKTIDAKTKRLANIGGDEQMPGFYVAVVDWRSALEDAISTDSGVMVDRAQDVTWAPRTPR